MPRQRLYLEPDLDARAHYWRMPEKVDLADINTLLEIDRLNYLPEYILRKGDLCTMAHGLELRAPFLDHRVFNCVQGLSPAERFTTPPKLILSEALSSVSDLGLLSQKKRGFNPPIRHWLQTDLEPRLPGLGGRLTRLTSGQLLAPRVEAFVRAWRRGSNGLGEQLLLLLILDESLRQLETLCAFV
jgi:asparagine synthase (glutamine-hydrolysing)